jgi:phosphoribosylaminoimidazole carboxylase PurE protein
MTTSIAHEVRIVPAHRTPRDLLDDGTTAAERGLRVLIGAAGGAAHLPGMLAAVTASPVIGVRRALEDQGATMADSSRTSDTDLRGQDAPC